MMIYEVIDMEEPLQPVSVGHYLHKKDAYFIKKRYAQLHVSADERTDEVREGYIMIKTFVVWESL